MSSKPRKRNAPRIFSILFFGSLIVSGILLVRSCTSEISPQSANIALQAEGKTWLYSMMGSTIVQSDIDSGKSPTVVPCVEVYIDGDANYVAPARLKALAAVLEGNLDFFAYNEPTHDGYITSADQNSFQTKIETRSGATIGEQIQNNTITLNHDGESLVIEWEFSPSGAEWTALQNCEVHSFYKQTNPSPGETVISSDDFLVIPLQTLADFYQCKITYDRDTKVVYVIQP